MFATIATDALDLVPGVLKLVKDALPFITSLSA